MAAWAPAVVKVACIPEASMSDKYNDHTCGSDVSSSNQRKRTWLTQVMWQTINLTNMNGVKMIGYESEKYYGTMDGTW